MMKANPEKAMKERVTKPNSVNHGAVQGTMAEHVPPASRSGNRAIDGHVTDAMASIPPAAILV